jgi:hypothetical protein
VGVGNSYSSAGPCFGYSVIILCACRMVSSFNCKLPTLKLSDRRHIWHSEVCEAVTSGDAKMGENHQWVRWFETSWRPSRRLLLAASSVNNSVTSIPPRDNAARPTARASGLKKTGPGFRVDSCNLRRAPSMARLTARKLTMSNPRANIIPFANEPPNRSLHAAPDIY